MPIHYACILNNRRDVVVLQGVYNRTQTIFKSQVLQNSNRIKQYGYADAPTESDLMILYHNWDTVTAAIVYSREVDRQECQEFMEQFKNYVEVNMLGRREGYQAPGMNGSASSDQAELYKPFQSSTSETAFQQFKIKVDNFITTWNDNPSNRSKMGQLREQLEETKQVVMEDLDLTMKRGQLLEDTKKRSESLKDQSYTMKKRSKDVKMKMCCRKYMYWIIGILVTIGLAIFLYFIIAN